MPPDQTKMAQSVPNGLHGVGGTPPGIEDGKATGFHFKVTVGAGDFPDGIGHRLHASRGDEQPVFTMPDQLHCRADHRSRDDRQFAGNSFIDHQRPRLIFTWMHEHIA